MGLGGSDSDSQDGGGLLAGVTVGEEDGEVALEDLFVFHHMGEDEHGKVIGHWECSGAVPRFVEEKMNHYRVDVPKDLFEPGTAERAWQF